MTLNRALCETHRHLSIERNENRDIFGTLNQDTSEIGADLERVFNITLVCSNRLSCIAAKSLWLVFAWDELYFSRPKSVEVVLDNWLNTGYW